MNKLKSYVIEENAIKSAFHIMEALKDLELQIQNAQNTLLSLRPNFVQKIKNNTVPTLAEFETITNLLRLVSDATAKRSLYKSDLLALKEQITNTEYKTEIQNEAIEYGNPPTT